MHSSPNKLYTTILNRYQPPPTIFTLARLNAYTPPRSFSARHSFLDGTFPFSTAAVKEVTASFAPIRRGRLKIYRTRGHWLLVFRYPIPYFENRFVTEARCSLLGNAAATHAVCISRRPRSAVPSPPVPARPRTSLIVSLLPFCTYLIPSSGIFHVA